MRKLKQWIHDMEIDLHDILMVLLIIFCIITIVMGVIDLIFGWFSGGHRWRNVLGILVAIKLICDAKEDLGF